MIRFLKNISISKKLFIVVGLMAFLIATELLTLLFTMDVLSSVRSFVGGEGLWSKAQKDAFYNLQRYSVTFDRKYYEKYLQDLKVPLGDRKARLELSKPNPDIPTVTAGFLEGQLEAEDIPGVIRLIQRFHDISYINHALKIWVKADDMIDEVMVVGEDLRQSIETKRLVRDYPRIDRAVKKLEVLNVQLTELENEFSYTLGEGSRWLEAVLRWILVSLVLTVEVTGLLLTISFARYLTRSLEELSNATNEIGRGNFTRELAIRSGDELGRLAKNLNRMTQDLKKNIGERKRAESASKIKSLFLANMSHEIRTPLGVILGLTEVLKENELTKSDQRKYLDIIERTGNNLKRIINDILDISKVEAGHLEIDKQIFLLSDFMKDLYSMLSVQAEQNKNRLEFICLGDIPKEVFTDKLRLRQILVNLIQNSLKFTKNGTVVLEYGVQGIKLFFRVIDTGIGISPEDQKELFKPFSQADNSITRKYEGTGLGLVLSKRLAGALGGDVVLERSEWGKGSSFLLTIAHDTIVPVKAKLADFKRENFDMSAMNGKKVLLVEDSEDNQLLIRVLLGRCGVILDVASNGEDGIQKALSNEYDLVLMDVQMPIMDGHTATQKLRSEGFKKPIIALTAHAMKEDREKSLKAGCNDYLTKPIEINNLYQAMYRHIFVEHEVAA